MAEKSKRGGARPGAGRKPKGHVAVAPIAGIDIAAVMALPAPSAVEPEARAHAKSSIEALVKIVMHGNVESARVVACNTILDRGYGKAATEGVIDAFLPFLGTAPTAPAQADIRAEARRYANLAISTLHRVAQTSPSESARVQAARSLLDRGLGTVAPAQIAAQAASAGHQLPAMPTPADEDPLTRLLQ